MRPVKTISVFFIVCLTALFLSGVSIAASMETGLENQSISDKGSAPVGFDKKPLPGIKATCPVMGHAFIVTAHSEHSIYKGKHYAFCCKGCKPKFDANPQKYLKK